MSKNIPSVYNVFRVISSEPILEGRKLVGYKITEKLPLKIQEKGKLTDEVMTVSIYPHEADIQNHGPVADVKFRNAVATGKLYELKEEKQTKKADGKKS